MKTMFENGFRPASAFFGSTLRGHAKLGVVLDRLERESMLIDISENTQKLAQVRAWMASLVNSDPMLDKTFVDPVIRENFLDFNHLAIRDQWAVDQAQSTLRNESATGWDLPEDVVVRVGDWVKRVEALHAAMQEYGGRKPGPETRPGTRPGTMATGATILGIPAKDALLGGGIAIGVGVLLYALLS